MIDDLADYSKTWTGYEAKYFEECAQSNNVEVNMYEKEYYAANTGIEWWGTVNPKSSTYCYKLWGTKTVYFESGLPEANQVEDSVNKVAKMAYKTFFNWVTSAYPEQFE